MDTKSDPRFRRLAWIGALAMAACTAAGVAVVVDRGFWWAGNVVFLLMPASMTGLCAGLALTRGAR